VLSALRVIADRMGRSASRCTPAKRFERVLQREGDRRTPTPSAVSNRVIWMPSGQKLRPDAEVTARTAVEQQSRHREGAARWSPRPALNTLAAVTVTDTMMAAPRRRAAHGQPPGNSTMSIATKKPRTKHQNDGRMPARNTRRLPRPSAQPRSNAARVCAIAVPTTNVASRAPAPACYRKSPRGQRRLFYGWIVIGRIATIICIGMGAVFARRFWPMADTMGWSRGAISSVALLNWIAMGLGSFFWGALSDRIGTRGVAVAGGLLLGLGLVLSSQVQALWQLYVTFGFMVGFAVGGFYAPLTSTATKWFTARRGLAVALVSSGIGSGSAVAPLPGAPAARLAHGAPRPRRPRVAGDHSVALLIAIRPISARPRWATPRRAAARLSTGACWPHSSG
jgi:hypothetical protein